MKWLAPDVINEYANLYNPARKEVIKKMNDKLIGTQKYFLFKLPDVLNNSFHTFEEKRTESLRLVLELCLDTYGEMNEISAGADKLAKSYKGLLSSLAFQLKRHPFRSLNTYSMDFDRLCILIEKSDKGSTESAYEVYLGIQSLLKKLNDEQLVERYIEHLQQPIAFAKVDILINALVSDLLYSGYSLIYLSEWYNSITREDGFHSAIERNEAYCLIERLKELDGIKKEYEIIIPYHVKSVSQQESAKHLLSKNFEVLMKDDKVEFSQHPIWIEETYACKKIFATDYYKAIELAKNEFATDKELLSMSQNSDVIRENVIMGCLFQGKLLTVDVRKIDNTKPISYSDKNRIRQLNSFIELKDGKRNEEIDILERILHTLHVAKTYSVQNRYLNFWSALEYALYSFPRNSIIEKARIVVSESFSLFYIKNKMNIFWDRLSYTMKKKGAETEHKKCKEFMDMCCQEKDFDTIKITEFLQDNEKCTTLLKDLDFHIVLKRELMELNMLVTDPEKLKNVIENYQKEIVHDLDCVYRLRNQLIHSAKGKDESLEYISLRLYRYVNSVVSTILYYKRRNAAVSIAEILNSLHNTYNVYMNKLDSLEKGKISALDGYALIRPKYLFLE